MNKIEIFGELALTIAKLSKDPVKKVGALILRPDFSICSMGYNGFPKGYPDTVDEWKKSDIKNSIVKHAEENAIEFSRDQNMSDYILIVTHYPCASCAGSIVQSGITKVFYIIHDNGFFIIK